MRWRSGPPSALGDIKLEFSDASCQVDPRYWVENSQIQVRLRKEAK